MTSAGLVLAVLVVTAISAILDAHGFVQAARAWSPAGQFVPRAAVLSLVYFLGGIALYVVSIRVLRRLGVESAAVQSACWFAMTIIGVALLDGSVTRWSGTQIAVGVGVTAGLVWLLATAPH